VLVEGYHDGSDCDKIFGWAWDSSQPNAAISVDIYDGATKIGTAPANEFRSDLTGKGNGFHAFNFPTPASLKNGQSHSITVKFFNTNTNLSNTPKSLTCVVNPSISNISPTTVTAGQFSLTINGSNFDPATARIVITGPNCPTNTSCVVPNNVLTTKNSGRLVGPVTINDAGSFNIRVQNGSGGTLSNGATLTVNAASPSISNISPTTVSTGQFSLTINGSNFDPATARIVITGPNCPTNTSCVVPNNVLTTKNSGQLVGPVTINDAGSFTVQVQNGAGGALSNGASLTVNAGAPSIGTISPTTVTAGQFSLTINGSNFDPATARIVITGPNCRITC